MKNIINQVKELQNQSEVMELANKIKAAKESDKANTSLEETLEQELLNKIEVDSEPVSVDDLSDLDHFLSDSLTEKEILFTLVIVKKFQNGSFPKEALPTLIEDERMNEILGASELLFSTFNKAITA